jgi:hypothetical protein
MAKITCGEMKDLQPKKRSPFQIEQGLVKRMFHEKRVAMMETANYFVLILVLLVSLSNCSIAKAEGMANAHEII